MRKRREEPFLVLAIALMLLFNVPLVMIGAHAVAWGGVPVFYIYNGSIWLLAIIVSYLMARRYNE